jgi:hypothetical protein
MKSLANREVVLYDSNAGHSLRAFTKLERKLLKLTPTEALNIEAVLRYPGARHKFYPLRYSDGMPSLDTISKTVEFGFKAELFALGGCRLKSCRCCFRLEKGGDFRSGGWGVDQWIALTSAGYQRAKRLLS